MMGNMEKEIESLGAAIKFEEDGRTFLSGPQGRKKKPFPW